jgi:type III secretion system YscD/HrpQ family protein
MAQSIPSDNTVLKVLSGVQNGVEVSLVDGEYKLGSGPDDDIQLIDVSLKPGHARLRVGRGKIEIAGGTGSLKTAGGLLGSGGEWHELEPLEIVSAGTTRFALGLPSANWASIADAEGDDAAARNTRKRPAAAGTSASGAFQSSRARQLGLAALVIVLAVGAGIFYAPSGLGDQRAEASVDQRSDLELTREVVQRFPFADSLDVHQEVDGTIYVSGYVETPVERRAIVGALREADVPARTRLWVTESMRGEIASLIEAEDVEVDYALSESGILTLDGIILDPARAREFVSLITDRMLGLAGVVSEISTSETLITDVADLAAQASIESLVLFRLDGTVIEANGLIPIERIDSWVGFLQAYSNKFADVIPLRSFVQLQGVSTDVSVASLGGGSATAMSGRALVLGAAELSSGETPLDIASLTEGTYDLSDVFVGQPEDDGATPGAATSATADPARLPASTADFLRPSGATATGGALRPATLIAASATMPMGFGSSGQDGVRGADGAPGLPGASGADGLSADAGDAPLFHTDAPRNGPLSTSDALDDLARWLIDGSNEAADSDRTVDFADPDIAGALERIQAEVSAASGGRIHALSAQQVQVAELYAPLFQNARRFGDQPAEACWAGSQLTAKNLAPVLFWLDILSVSEGISITFFDHEAQTLILEAALNPREAARCVAGSAAPRSVYIAEVERNPTFLQFIIRDLPGYTLDIAGASLADRYIQTRAGQKMQEGSAPDGATRIALVGELGIALQVREGMTAVAFGPDINWLIQ